MKYFFNILLTITFIVNFVSVIKANSIKIAVLKYGSVNWEYDVIKHHKLDEKNTSWFINYHKYTAYDLSIKYLIIIYFLISQ